MRALRKFYRWFNKLFFQTEIIYYERISQENLTSWKMWDAKSLHNENNEYTSWKMWDAKSLHNENNE